MGRTGFVYLFVSLFCALFGAVYERFSHGVFSYYMIYAFAVPLAGGVLPFFVLAGSEWRVPGRLARNLYHSGIAAFTVGCLFRGALEIYGTTNRLSAVYWVAGGIFLLSGVLCYGLGQRKQ